MGILQTYGGILITVTIVVVVGVLVTQGLLGDKYADLATGIILGGGGGFLAGVKTTPKEN